MLARMETVHCLLSRNGTARLPMAEASINAPCPGLAPTVHLWWPSPEQHPPVHGSRFTHTLRSGLSLQPPYRGPLTRRKTEAAKNNLHSATSVHVGVFRIQSRCNLQGEKAALTWAGKWTMVQNEEKKTLRLTKGNQSSVQKTEITPS